MSSPESVPGESRQQLLDHLTFQLSRQLSTRTVLFHATIAERMRLSQGDHKAMDLIYEAEQEGRFLTAGQLAEATGLTTGAITGVIDRLEKAQVLRRVPDGQDRRKIVIQPTHARDEELWALLSPIAQQTVQLTSRYSDAELAVIADYIGRLVEMTRLETQRLREG